MPRNEPTPDRPHGLVFTHTEIELVGSPPVAVADDGGRCTVSVGHGPGVVVLHGPTHDVLAFALAIADRLGGRQ